MTTADSDTEKAAKGTTKRSDSCPEFTEETLDESLEKDPKASIERSASNMVIIVCCTLRLFHSLCGIWMREIKFFSVLIGGN